MNFRSTITAIVLLISGFCSYAQESVSFIDFPSEFSADALQFTLHASYTVSEQRDINVELKSPDNKYITSSKKTIEAGSSETQITLNLTSPLAEGDKYKFILSIRTKGGSWETNIDTDVKYASLVKDNGGEPANNMEVYVSTQGDDSNNGSFESPFKTIQKASNTMLPGGICYIRKGVYRETVTIAKANQTFQNYDNEYVLITGLDSLSGWTEYKDGIYKTKFTNYETQFTQLFLNGHYQQMARFPNNTTGDMMDVSLKSGFAAAEAFNQEGTETTRKVTFATMPTLPDDYWKGGYYRGITGLTWQNPHGEIAASTGRNLTVTPGFSDWTKNAENIAGGGVGFIFHLNALDREGEWYAQDDEIYVMPPAQTDINTLSLEAQKREYAFTTTENGMVLKGLHIKAASIEIKASDCVVDSCTVRYLFPYFTRKNYHAVFDELGGIYIKGDRNTFRNCYIASTWGNGFSLESGDGNSFDNNRIEDIGWNAQFTSSILTHADNTTIKNNTFGSTGRFHIRFQNKTDILYNDLYDCMKMGQDAGSIEATSGGAYDTPLDIKNTVIAHNLMHDCTTLSSFKSTKNFVVALYIEDAYNYTAHHNVIWNYRTQHKQGSFVYLGPRRTTIKNVNYYNNTVWDCDKGIGIWNRESLGNILDTRFYNNLWDANMSMDDEIADFPEMEFLNNIKMSSANTHLNNYAAGDLSLKASSSAIDSGKEIPGITDGFSGSAPDVGAYEYGNAKWTAGANIEIPVFEDEKEIPTSLQSHYTKPLTVYPNPCGDTFTISNTQKTAVSIFDLNGIQLLSQNTGASPTQIDISFLPTGIYLLRAITHNGQHSFSRIIKK